MTSSLRIATWNLNRPGPAGADRNAAIIAKMAEINADIWVLTETNVSLSPGHTYNPWSSPDGQPFRRPGERATMIWSRFPLRRTLPTFAGMPLRDDAADPIYPSYSVLGEYASPAICAEIVTPIGPLLVYGTIITWFGDRGPRKASGYEEEQRRSIPLYRADWAQLAPDAPLCVAGDFNARICEPKDKVRAETKVTRGLLTEAFAHNHLVCTTEHLGYCIDHICLSQTWAERAGAPQQWQGFYGTGQRPVTDHKGTYVDIAL
jgi:hypothetical protein